MTTQHTPTPWKVYEDACGDLFISSTVNSKHVIDIGSDLGDEDNVRDDAARIVACVNACAGIPTEVLAPLGLSEPPHKTIAENERRWKVEAQQQRDELRAKNIALLRLPSQAEMAELIALRKTKAELLNALKEIHMHEMMAPNMAGHNTKSQVMARIAKEAIAKVKAGVKMSKCEESVIEFESARNEAIDKFYAARPWLERAVQWDFLFKAGFRMAWELLKRETSAKTGEH